MGASSVTDRAAVIGTPEQRREAVGASEVASLFNIGLDLDGNESPAYHSRLELWARKLGLLVEDEQASARSELFAWGHALEPVILRMAVEHLGVPDMVPGRRWHHPAEPRLAATPDFVVPDGSATGECKNVNDWEFRRWPDCEFDLEWRWWTSPGWEPAQRRPPLKFLLQKQAQLAVVGALTGREPVGYLVALVGGSRLVAWRVKPHPAMQARILEEVRSFWLQVERRERPEPVLPYDAAALEAMLLGSVRPSSSVDLSSDPLSYQLAYQYHYYKAVSADADAWARAFKAQLLERMGGAERAQLPEGVKVSAPLVRRGTLEYRQFRVRGFPRLARSSRVDPDADDAGAVLFDGDVSG